jgi:hypothetical protein
MVLFYETVFSSCLEITVGTTCRCEHKEHGSPYGVCGDGYSCICSQNPINNVLLVFVKYHIISFLVFLIENML